MNNYYNLIFMISESFRSILKQWDKLDLIYQEEFISTLKSTLSIIHNSKYDDLDEATLKVISVANLDFLLLAPEAEKKLGFKPRFTFKY